MKDQETGGAWAMALAALTILGNWKMVQTWGEKLGDIGLQQVERWLKGRPKRQLKRRCDTDEQVDRVLDHEREEVETLILMLKEDHDAGRVTLFECQWPADASQPVLAKCLHEARDHRTMSSMRVQFKNFRPLEPELRELVLQIFGSPSRCLFIQDIRQLDNTTVRSQLLRSGARSAYYHALPDSSGNCGGLLALSWPTVVELSAEQRAGLLWRGRFLGSMQRTLWAFELAEPQPAKAPC